MSDDSKKEKKQFRRPLFHKIVNVFIGIVATLLFLLIIFFGFSQTKTFRNILKKQITEQVSDAINGTIQIQDIEGSVLSSLILHDIFLTSDGDTLVEAKEITIKTSPIHLLLKKILVRDIIIKNAIVRLTEDDNGKWSFSKLSKEENITETLEEVESKEESPFPFSIQVNNINFQNLSFVRQTYNKINSNEYYKHVTVDDLRLSGIFLEAKLFANLSNSTVKVLLNKFSVEPNFQSFNLKNLSGNFEFTKNHALVNNLTLVTDNSNIKINAKVDSLNLLGSIELKDFKDYPIQLKAEATPIDFSDLYTFIDATDFLNGQAYFDLNANGYFGDFNVSKLDLNFMNSKIHLSGKVQKLHTPEKLFIDAHITNSEIVESEVHTLLKGLDIPNYKNLVIKNLDMKVKGEPTRFHAVLNGDINKGKIFIDTYLDLQTKQMEYDIDFQAQNLDIFPLFGVSTSINGKGSITGFGTDPNFMEANLNFYSSSSIIDSINVDSLFLISKINSKIFNIDLDTKINGARTTVEGLLDLRNDGEPIYDLFGETNNLNLKTITGAVGDSSNLNLTFTAKGKNLEIDEMVGNYEIKLKQSFLRDLDIEETSLSLSLTTEEEKREINLISDFVDFHIDGQFSLAKAIELLSYEGFTISQIISDKINELNPIEQTNNITVLSEKVEIPPIVKEDLEFNYNFLFKDFELIALLLENDELDITGSGEGVVINDSRHFEISTDLYIDNLLNKKKNDILYLSNVEANFNFSRDNRFVSFNNIFGTITVEGEKIYAGVEVNKIQADIIFNQSKMFFNTSFGVEDDLNAEIEGIVSTSPTSEKIVFNNILLNYKKIPWQSVDTSSIIFAESGAQLTNLILEHNNTILNLNGQINSDESHNIFIDIEHLSGNVATKYLSDNNKQPLNADINLTFSSSGFLYNPEINIDLYVNNISYNRIDFGSLYCLVNHNNNKSLIDIDFIDKKRDAINSVLTLDGTISFDLNYLNNKEILSDVSSLSFSMISDSFNIGSFGNLLPYIKNQSGNINAKIDLEGNFNNLKTKGFLNLDGGKFTYRDNNLDYSVDVKTEFKDQTVTVSDLILANDGGSTYKGKILGSGNIFLEQLPFNEIDLTLNGNLALLGKNSKTRDANIYGDLLVRTETDCKFTYNDNKYVFAGNIVVDNANLIYTTQYVNNLGNDNRIIYNIIEDSSKNNINNKKFIRILNETINNNNSSANVSKSKFELRTDIIIENIASFDFIISPQLNQKLSIETTGRLQFATIGNEIKTQGTLKLLNSSRLEFFKTFDAEGTIRFESDAADPHFNIIATYISEIQNFENSNKTEQVAVKLKLNTPFSELQEDLSKRKDNLKVYVGRSQIENDIPDLKYGQSNALTFIILDQLDLNLNDEQKNTLGAMTENVAFSLLGSQLTTYLNSSLGGLINNIRLNRFTGRDSYKLLFSGKYNNVRYSFGGNFGSKTEYLQLSKADIKVEYLFNPNFLIRLEQKDPIIESAIEEKVQELGIKYKFEF